MAVIKTYEMQMIGYENTFPVFVGNIKTYLSFKKASPDEGEGYLHTDKKEIQEAIEASDKYQKGAIKLVKAIGEEEVEEEEGKLVAREDVKDFQSARDILLREPYNLKPQAVPNNPDAILKAAAKAGISFPNLAVE